MMENFAIALVVLGHIVLSCSARVEVMQKDDMDGRPNAVTKFRDRIYQDSVQGFLGLISDPQEMKHSIDCPSLCACRLTDSLLKLRCQKGYNDNDLAAYFKANPGITDVTFILSFLTGIPSSLCKLPHLVSLDLAHNQIFSIEISCLQKLETLDLEYNMIIQLDKATFEGFKSLKTIKLNNNRISSIHRLSFLHSHLKNLSTIELQFNKLETADTWMFRLPAFENRMKTIVNLSCNSIHTAFNTFDFRASEVSRSQEMLLDFRRNQIRYIGDLQTIMQIEHWTDAWGLWNCGFDFHFNPFDCDCVMYKMLSFLRPFIKIFEVFTDLYYIQLHCATPLDAQDKLIYKVPDDVFRCYINESCPQGAECMLTPGNSTMTVRNKDPAVESLPSEVPKETNIHIIYPNTRIHTLSEMEYLSNVTAIDLSNTSLSNITDVAAWHLLRQVRHINFRECKLSVLSDAFTSASASQLQTVDLAGNPFQCDCHMRHMQEWMIAHSKTLVDINLILCSNIPFRDKPIINVPEKFLICGYKYIFAGIAVTILLLIIIICYIIFSAMRRRIMLRLVMFFGTNFTLGSTTTPRVLKYHATIYVTEEDRELVDEFCDVLENSGEYLVHRLGYFLDSPKLDIVNKLPESEGCLLFLSTQAMQDNHGIFCFRFAVDQFIRHYHRMFLIPVLLDSKDTLVTKSKVREDTKLFLRMFDSVDISTTSQEFYPQKVEEITEIMKRQVIGFPHILDTQTNITVRDENSNTHADDAVHDDNLSSYENAAVHDASLGAHENAAVHDGNPSSYENDAVHDASLGTHEHAAVHDGNPGTYENDAVHDEHLDTHANASVHDAIPSNTLDDRAPWIQHC